MHIFRQTHTHTHTYTHAQSHANANANTTKHTHTHLYTLQLHYVEWVHDYAHVTDPMIAPDLRACPEPSYASLYVTDVGDCLDRTETINDNKH